MIIYKILIYFAKVRKILTKALSRIIMMLKNIRKMSRIQVNRKVKLIGLITIAINNFEKLI